MFGKDLDDPIIADMDPVRKMWMFYNWLEDQNEKVEIAKNHAYLLASFWNPEAVQKILGDDNTSVSSDEDFEESLKMVRDFNIETEKANKVKKKRRKKKATIKQD